MPTVSVLIPAFNTSAYIGEAIRSVLHQTLRPFEVIVVDDGSRDDTAAAAESFGDPVKVFRRPHAGIAASRNFAASQARGELLAFLDSDDLWPPDKLALQAAHLVAESSCDGVFGLVRQFYASELDVPSGERERLEQSLESGYHAGALLLRRSAFERVGPFDESRRVGEFIDWYARAQDEGLGFSMLRRVVMLRRIHRTNTGVVQASARSDYAKVLKAVLDRRKAASRERMGRPGKEGTG